MDQRFTELRCKEVININDGCRLGYVGDLDLRIPEGEITRSSCSGCWGAGRNTTYPGAVSSASGTT